MMHSKSIQYDLANMLQPLPAESFNEADVENIDELGRVLLSRHISPHVGVSSGAAGLLPFPATKQMWTPTNGPEAAHHAIVRWRSDDGIIRLTPDDLVLSPYDGIAEDIGLLNGFRLPMDELLAQDRRKTLVLSSPNGISGQIAGLQEMVRLIRHFALVVIDERLAAFSLRRLTPLVVEWENVVSIQRFPFIMPEQSQPFGWMIHPGPLQEHIVESLEPLLEDAESEALHYGGIETNRAERHIARRKSQLFRELRKLSIVSVPYSSWSNSLLAKVERGNRDEIVQQLADRGIAVYAPPQPNLQQHLRITAVSNEATFALRDALIEFNREI